MHTHKSIVCMYCMSYILMHIFVPDIRWSVDVQTYLYDMITNILPFDMSFFSTSWQFLPPSCPWGGSLESQIPSRTCRCKRWMTPVGSNIMEHGVSTNVLQKPLTAQCTETPVCSVALCPVAPPNIFGLTKNGTVQPYHAQPGNRSWGWPQMKRPRSVRILMVSKPSGQPANHHPDNAQSQVLKIIWAQWYWFLNVLNDLNRP